MSTAAPTLAERLAAVRSEIADAASVAGRNVDDITTIVVTKFHPASLIRELSQLGVRDVGENRHQDAAPKAAELASLDLTWHFIGQLQSNKVRAVLDYASDIQSVDRPSLVSAIAAVGKPVDAFIQLNLTNDAGRGGVTEASLDALVETVLAAPTVTLRGLMAVAPLGEDPRRAFERVRRVSERMLRSAPTASALSMGMSGDFREAVLEGATHLRIGTAITGKRADAG
ncbi:MAG: YggS family pyridoxal phosphate-dependent enzyme [Glaciihabitans sp.]|jgi:pyridoxal phosphate enzyme (YggS family)|nr:YggS family pyridoxal phosphate-dependent enzyme [Glaciihabitans sp.]